MLDRVTVVVSRYRSHYLPYTIAVIWELGQIFCKNQANRPLPKSRDSRNSARSIPKSRDRKKGPGLHSLVWSLDYINIPTWPTMQETGTYAPYAQMTVTVCIARPRAESTGCRPRIRALERMIVDGCRRKPESAKEFVAVRNEASVERKRW